MPISLRRSGKFKYVQKEDGVEVISVGKKRYLTFMMDNFAILAYDRNPYSPYINGVLKKVIGPVIKHVDIYSERRIA